MKTNKKLQEVKRMSQDELLSEAEFYCWEHDGTIEDLRKRMLREKIRECIVSGIQESIDHALDETIYEYDTEFTFDAYHIAHDIVDQLFASNVQKVGF